MRNITFSVLIFTMIAFVYTSATFAGDEITKTNEAKLYGTADIIEKTKDGHLSFTGWALDGSVSGSPVQVTITLDDDIILDLWTKGPRTDVAKAYPAYNTQNVVFTGASNKEVSCEAVSKLHIVVKSKDGRASNLPVPRAIKGCNS